MATVNTNLVNSFGAGSGVDTKSLAQNLVDAEKAPKQKLIDDKITGAKARISGLTAMMAGLNVVKKAFTDLSTSAGLNSLSVSNSQPMAFSVSTNANAKEGLRSVQVNKLAKPQMSEVQFGGDSSVGKYLDLPQGLTAPTLSGNSSYISIELTVAGLDKTVKVPVTASSTAASGYKVNLDDFASAVNESGAGVSASVIFPGQNSGKYKLVLTGPVGAASGFSIKSDGGAGLTLPAANTANAISQAASDAEVVVDGVTYQRSSNVISDVISGTTLTLASTTTGAATVQTTRDVAALKDKVNALIKAYNDTQSDLKVLSGPKNTQDTTDTYSGSLQNDSTVRSVSGQLRDMMTGSSLTAAADASIKRLLDLGVTIDRSGVASLDETKFNDAVTKRFDQVVGALAGRAFAADGSLLKGVSGVAVDKLSNLMGPSGILVTRSNNANQDITRYQKSLTDLNDRMTKLLERYTKQFASMDSIVGQTNSLKTSLKSQFDGMLAAYKQ